MGKKKQNSMVPLGSSETAQIPGGIPEVKDFLFGSSDL